LTTYHEAYKITGTCNYTDGGRDLSRQLAVAFAFVGGDLLLLKQLWHEHQTAPFPKASRGREVAGHDLIALDYTAAGCVSTFINRATLDTWRLAVLGLCYHGLGLVVAQLEGEERAYFIRLERLAGLVLEAVRDGSPPAF
jgi:hypothetical protein